MSQACVYEDMYVFMFIKLVYFMYFWHSKIKLVSNVLNFSRKKNLLIFNYQEKEKQIFTNLKSEYIANEYLNLLFVKFNS